MTEHFVTLFDSLFLPQGLALQASLERHAGHYTLWVLCMDDVAYEVLSRLALPNVRTVRLGDVETDALRAVKSDRSRGEYCWTITPFTPAMVFDTDATVRRVTYVDADVWFRDDPRKPLDELTRAGKAVLLTEHAFAPEYQQLHIAGRFCVQFMTFERGRSERMRAWWAERCIEWCFARWEDGRFGDQMYLEDWPTRFNEEVHVLQALQLCQAPWNVTRFNPQDAAMYHFHGLRLLSNGSVWLSTTYRLTNAAMAAFYRPYVSDLRAAAKALACVGHATRPQIGTPPWKLKALEFARRLKHGHLREWQPMTLSL